MNTVDRLANAIISSQLPIATIARKTKISRTGIYNIINKKVSYVNFDTIKAIAFALNIKITELVEEYDDIQKDIELYDVYDSDYSISKHIDLSKIEALNKPSAGQWLEALRILNGFDKKQLAREIDAEQNDITKWECNIDTPEIEIIFTLARVLNIETDILLLIFGYKTY